MNQSPPAKWITPKPSWELPLIDCQDLLNRVSDINSYMAEGLNEYMKEHNTKSARDAFIQASHILKDLVEVFK